MGTRMVATVGIWMFLAARGMADTYIRQPSVDVIRYDISMEVTDASDSIAGITIIQVLIRSETASGMWLDFEDMTVDKLLVEGIERALHLWRRPSCI